VPSRLIGATLKARIRSERLDLYHGAAHVLTLPRLTGRNQRRITGDPIPSQTQPVEPLTLNGS